MNDYKNLKSFDERRKESSTMRQKYPNRVCLYLTKSKNSTLPESDKKKYLVPHDLTIGQVMHVIRKRIDISPKEAIFLFTSNNVCPSTSTQIGTVYSEHADHDGFLYMTYNSESTFGSSPSYASQLRSTLIS